MNAGIEWKEIISLDHGGKSFKAIDYTMEAVIDMLITACSNHSYFVRAYHTLGCMTSLHNSWTCLVNQEWDPELSPTGVLLIINQIYL